MTRRARAARGWSVLALVAAGCKAGAASEASGATGTGAATGTSAESTDSETGAEPERLALEFVEIPWSGEALHEITDMRFFPGSSELLLLSKPGIFHHFEIIGDEAVELGAVDLAGTYPDNDCGLLSIAFDPSFAENSLFYVSDCVDQFSSGVYRYVWDPDDYAAVVASRTQIIVEGDPEAIWPWHNVGSIGFFSDETMWIGFGDKTVDANGQDRSTNLGAMLRIVPDRDPSGPGGYEGAPGNPFPGSPDIWAYGLRVPFRAGVDDRDRIVVADVGSTEWEEIDLIDGPGLNFGWDLAEGPCAADCAGLVDPIVGFPHAVNAYALDDPEVVPNARWVGWVSPFYAPAPELDRYSGLLTGRVLFGDMCSGWVRALGVDEDGAVDYDQHAGHLRHAAAWAVGGDGYVYAVASGGCANSEFDAEPAVMVRAVQVPG